MTDEKFLKPRSLSVRNAAKRLDVSEGCVRNMVKRNELKHFKAGRLIRIPLAAIEAMERGECISSNTEENGPSASAVSAAKRASTPPRKL